AVHGEPDQIHIHAVLFEKPLFLDDKPEKPAQPRTVRNFKRSFRRTRPPAAAATGRRHQRDRERQQDRQPFPTPHLSTSFQHLSIMLYNITYTSFIRCLLALYVRISPRVNHKKRILLLYFLTLRLYYVI